MYFKPIHTVNDQSNAENNLCINRSSTRHDIMNTFPPVKIYHGFTGRFQMMQVHLTAYYSYQLTDSTSQIFLKQLIKQNLTHIRFKLNSKHTGKTYGQFMVIRQLHSTLFQWQIHGMGKPKYN